MSNSSTIQPANPSIRKQLIKELIAQTLLNGESVNTLTEGQEVYISGNSTVKARSSGSQYPIGVVKVGAVAGEKLSVVINAQCDVAGIAIGGTLNAGQFVKPNGVKDANDLPQYVAAHDGEYAMGIVLEGGAVNSQIKVLVLFAPVPLVTNS